MPALKPLRALLLLAMPALLTAQELPTGRFAGPGGIVLVLTADARYSFERQGGVIIAGGLRLESGGLVLQDDAGMAACAQPGRYTWQRAGDTLRFSVVGDSCEGRRGAITASAWIRLREALALTHATLLDMTGAPPRPGMTLLLRDGKIAALYPDGTVPLASDATERDLGGGFVLPGLIDAHVHLATNPSSREFRSRTEAALKNALLGGVVAVRDMAGDARALADLARAVAAGDIAGPEIRFAAVLAGPGFFVDPRVRASSAGYTPGLAPWARAVTDSADLRQLVAEVRGTGASAVKMYADLDARLATRVAAEARRQGLGVWAHLTLAPARPSEVATSGVQVVSHAMLIPWEVAPPPDWKSRLQMDLSITATHPAVQRLFALMRERNLIFDPTLFVYRADSLAADTSFARRREARATEFVRAAHGVGIRIAAGTDGMGADGNALPNIHIELELLVRAGLTPHEALVAATRTAAEVAGLAATHGSIVVGKAADLLVLRSDPLADIRNTRQIALVLRRGRVVEK